MKKFALLIVAGSMLSACAHREAPSTNAERPVVCSSGLAAVYFQADSSLMAYTTARNLGVAAGVAEECNMESVTVVGLPQPSAGLLGQRAQAVATMLKLFGVPEPSFELGNERDQRAPVVQWEAVPKR